jgi:hypothetical protein
MEDFNLKKFLVENRLTSNSRMLKEGWFDDTMYNIFKGKEGFGNRIKATPETVEKLIQISRERGLNTDETENSKWAWKKGSDKMDWSYDGREGYLYYGDEYKDLVNSL